MDCFERNQLAFEYEREGNIDLAIELYEENVAELFEGNCPYDRLVYLYTKSNDFANVERVLEQAIWVFENVVYVKRADRVKKLERFKKQLKGLRNPGKRHTGKRKKHSKTFKYVDSKSGLRFEEILMLFYVHKYSTETKEYESFWKNRYNVNPEEVLYDLFNQGYVEMDSIKTSLEHAKISELKEILNKFKLSLSGNKKTLIVRVLENIPYNDIDNEFWYRYYTLTDEGQNVVNDNLPVLFAHRHPNLDINISKAKRYKNINDYLWGKLNEDSLKYQFKEEWGLYRNCRFEMAKILIKEHKYENALRFLVEVCYCDTIDNGLLHSSNIFEFAPGIIKQISAVQKHLNYSDEDLYNECLLHLETFDLPQSKYNNNELINMIISDVISYE